MDDVDFLALGGVLGLEPGHHLPSRVDRNCFVLLDRAHGLRQVRDYEGVRVRWREFVKTRIGKVDGVTFLIHREVEQFVDFKQAFSRM